MGKPGKPRERLFCQFCEAMIDRTRFTDHLISEVKRARETALRTFGEVREAVNAELGEAALAALRAEEIQPDDIAVRVVARLADPGIAPVRLRAKRPNRMVTVNFSEVREALREDDDPLAQLFIKKKEAN